MGLTGNPERQGRDPKKEVVGTSGSALSAETRGD